MSRHPAPASGPPRHRPAGLRRRSGRTRRRRVARIMLLPFLAAVVLSSLFLSRHVDGDPGIAGAVAQGRSHQAATPAFTRSTAAAREDTDGFVTARISAEPIGTGTVRRFKVRVEEGIGLSADGVAREIHGVLADPRSWTADGHDGFQLVSDGSRDFVVVVASPATVDRICGAAGLRTRGEVNCDVGSRVFVNLKRWQTGSPNFHGSLADYRALIINHEVGHRIGHGHETCPGPGRPAPAMMQQINGLDGCEQNAWPYDADGTYLGGPKVP
ncbi:DUF3152 domain-containing protein [Streptomyces parvulus]|nr:MULTISPECIES: DUF3152 domain-containing protein [Streptomyces]